MRKLCGCIALTLTLGGCGSRPAEDAMEEPAVPNAAAAPLASDTLRGELRVVGSEPATGLVLASRQGLVPLIVDRNALLWRAQGLDVCVRVESDQREEGKRARVLGYSVRSFGDQPAMDGIVTASDDSFDLRTADGTPHRVLHPQPTALRVGVRLAYSRAASTMLILGAPLLPVDSLWTSCDAVMR